MINFEQWEGFEGRIWKEEVNVRDFIQKNYTPYDGDESFLAGPTEATDKLWGALQKLQKAERAKGGVLDMETEVVSSLTAYGPGYIDESLKDLEQIVGLQNIRNERRDANIDEKYGTPIRFMEKNAKVIALVILLGLMMISVGITVLILKFR